MADNYVYSIPDRVYNDGANGDCYFKHTAQQEHKGQAMARPKITTEDFPNDWKQSIVEQYAEGASDIEVYGSYLDICHETFTRLINEDDEFSEAIKKGRRLSEAWWVKNGRTNLKDREFNYTGWYMQMKNRFGWKDKTETDITTKGESINLNAKDMEILKNAGINIE